MHRILPALLSLLALACGESAPSDAATDGPAAQCDAAPPAFEAGTDGHPAPLAVPPGQSRAGRLDAASLPADANGLATWEAGDFVLASDRVALIVEDAGDSDLYDPYGGRPVGIARVEGGRLVEAGDFNEVLWGVGAYLVETADVTVLSDGSDGGAAVIRARGPLGSLEFAGDLLSSIVPGDYAGHSAALDYEMQPGSDAIDVFLSVANGGPAPLRVSFLLTGFFQRFRMPSWLEGAGFAIPDAPVPAVSFVDDRATSYTWMAPPGHELSKLFDQAGVLVFSTGPRTLPGCEVTRLPLGTMVLGGPGLPGLRRAHARRTGTPLRTVRGAVREANASPARDVRLHVRRADGSHFARLAPGPDGRFALDVPQEPISIFVYREGTSLVGPVEVATDRSDVAITMPARSTIVVDVAEAGSTPRRSIPARVQVIPSGGAPRIPDDLGERRLGDRAHVAFTTTGSVSLPVDPGRHEVIVSRGYEYEIARRTVDVGATSATVSVDLDHVVDTSGLLCADYHIHTHRSPDSPDSPELKLLGLIADGLEIPVRSDHEWVNDFQPLIERLGLTEYAFGISSEELTTFAWGHFGVFPLREDRSRPNGSAVTWVGRLPPDVFAEVRARPEAPVLIVNHPRSGGAFGGYFVAAGFDPTTGSPSRTSHWDEAFTLVEVFNDESFEEASTIVRDWFALLASGRRVFAVGSSDSHNIYGSPVGYPRTCLALGTDDPRDLTPERVRDVTAAGHSTVSGGLYLTVLGPGGVGPGEEATGVGEVARFDVMVQAASWIEGADRLEVYVDGALTETIPIPADPPDPLRPVVRLAARGITVPVAPAGSWVVFHAGSAPGADLSPVHPDRRPFAVSNPVFLRR